MLKKFAITLLAALITALPLGGIVSAAAVGTNLITNPSMETAAVAGTPDGWTNGGYGDVAAASTLTYETTGGHTGNSLKTTVAGYTPAPAPTDPATVAPDPGDAKWYFTPITVTPGVTYEYTQWYKTSANTETQIDAQLLAADKATYVDTLATVKVSSSTEWKQVTVSFTVPLTTAAGSTVTVFQSLSTNGTVQIDDADLHTYVPTPFTKPMISVTFDDGWINQYTNAAPYMQTKGLIGTYYIISDASVTAHDDITNNYMNSAQVLDLYSKGNEIASHTVHHCDLANSGAAAASTNCPVPLLQDKILNEMQQSKTALQTLLNGTPVTDFAYPYGAYDANTIALGQSLGYLSQRTVDAGFNTKDSLNATQLKMYEVDHDTTTAQVKAWMDQAVAEHTWLILCYHEVADVPADAGDLAYTAPLQNFKDQMDYLATLKAQGTDVLTVAQALQQAQNEINGVPTTPAPLAVSAALGTSTGQNTATITWLTNLAASSQVRYGLDTTYGSTTTLGTQLITNHAVNLTGLAAATAYHFQVVSVDASNATAQSVDMTFTTAPLGKPGDVSGDGIVNDDDAIMMFANWGKTGVGIKGDINGNGRVDDDDAIVMFANWSK